MPDPDGLSGFQGPAGRSSSSTASGRATRPSGSTTVMKGRAASWAWSTRTAPPRPSAASTSPARRRRSTAICGKVVAVKELATQDEALAMKDGVMVVYAPWCQFCQGMEEAYEKFAADAAAKGITVAKYRGDEDRDFVQSNFNTEWSPTINVIKGGKATKYEWEDRSVEAPRRSSRFRGVRSIAGLWLASMMCAAIAATATRRAPRADGPRRWRTGSPGGLPSNAWLGVRTPETPWALCLLKR